MSFSRADASRASAKPKAGPSRKTPAGAFPAGASYSAHDAELLRWVHATLLDSIPLTYELLVGPTRFNPDTRTEFGALYEVTIEHIAAFIPTEEIGATLWWNGAELSHELDGIDRKLIELARARHQRVA